MAQWDKIYKNEGLNYDYYDITKPHENMPEILKFLKKRKVNKILDLGCGAGRHLKYLSKNGFEVYGIDSSREGIKLAKVVLDESFPKNKLKIGNVFKKLPYKKGFFDAVVSVQVLQHGTASDIKSAISEIERVLKPRGIVFITLRGRYFKGKLCHCIIKTANKIAPRTYVPTMGSEKGLVHFIYNKKIIWEHYRNFRIIKFWKDDKDYYCIIGEKKIGV